MGTIVQERITTGNRPLAYNNYRSGGKLFQASELVNMSEDDVWNLPDGSLSIQFDDGFILNTGRRRTILSWYFWEFHRRFPGTPVLSSHHIGNAPLRKGFETKHGAVVFWNVHDGQSNPPPNLVWDMSECFYEIINALHNITISRLSRYVTTVDLSDLYGVMTDPVVAEARAMAASKELTYEEAYAIIRKELLKPKPNFLYNNLAKLTRTNLLSPKQLVQFVGARGYAFATDGSLYPEGIDASYSDGFDTLYDSITESRSASRALYMNDDPLKDSEYFNRRMQLLCEVIRCVEGEDCGSTHTIPWVVHREDLKSLHGKYYMDNGVPVMFTRDREDLVNKVVDIRTITGCRNRDTTTVCKTCIGFIHKVIPPGTNLGHFLVADPLADISQLMLSTKHVESSQGALVLPLAGEAYKWMKYDLDNKCKLRMRHSNAANRYILRFAEAEAHGLNNVLYCKDPASLLPQRISEVSEILLANADGEGNQKGEFSLIPTVVGGVGSALSSEVLAAMKTNGWRIVGNFVEVVLDNFTNNPLIITPRRGEDMITYQRTIKHFIFGSQDKGDAVVGYTTAGQAVAALKRLFDEKISTNLVHAEIFIRACMTVDGKGNDFRLPRGGEPFTFMAADNIISNRSVVAALAYEGQRELITNYRTYLAHDRPPHILDPTF